MTDETSPLPIPCWIERPCSNGHVMLWYSGSAADRVPPKGTTCQCGYLVANGEGGYEEWKP